MYRLLNLIFVIIILSLVFNSALINVHADSSSDIQGKIDQRTQDIKNLEKEIAGYQSQIDALDTKASSLSSTIASLNLTQKKLAANIKVTQDKISSQNFEIQRLSQQIGQHESNIKENRRVIAQAFVTLLERGDMSVVKTVLGSESLSKTIDSLDQISIIQSELYNKIDDISKAKTNLEINKKATERARSNLVALSNQLKDQNALVASTKAAQNKLLADTKQSESQYQALLTEKKKLKDAFEQELLGYESQLKTIINAKLLPHTGSGVLSWPLDSIVTTQYFGNTDFATANPQVYNGKGHTGVDFRASIGTPVKAALAGVVVGSGNTDSIPGCYSYGKWIMIRHSNGLSTLYAHLSLPIVTVGSTVTTGQLIGYSGNTGYTTGPHLHFSVYATQGVVITKLTSSKNCRNAVIPVAPFSAYLNPLSYL